MVKKKPKQQLKQPVVAAPVQRKPAKNKNLAIAALIINIILPGLGTIIGKDTKKGLAQLILALVGLVLKVALGWVGGIICLIAWIWALVTSIKMLQA